MEREQNLLLVAGCIASIDAKHKSSFCFLCDGLDANFLGKVIECMCNADIPKCQNYYEEVIPRQSISTFRSHFRMTLATFEVILDQICFQEEFSKRNEELFGGRKQIGPEKMLLIALWTLATPECYRAVGDRFNVTKSSVFYYLNTVIQCVNKYLCPKFIKWPENKPITALAFQDYGLPRVIGAIDGCHIPIKEPKENGDYYNRKKIYSVVLQGVCQKNLSFTDVDVSWPGSVHDARVLRTSDIYSVGGDICNPNYYIIGDSAYPCLKWLLTP